MSKSRFSEGLGNLERLGGKPARPSLAAAEEPAAPEKAAAPAGRAGKVSIAGYFDPAVRKQLAMLAIEHDTDQVKLLGEALNLLFEKYGRSPIAKA